MSEKIGYVCSDVCEPCEFYEKMGYCEGITPWIMSTIIAPFIRNYQSRVVLEAGRNIAGSKTNHSLFSNVSPVSSLTIHFWDIWIICSAIAGRIFRTIRIRCKQTRL